MGTATFPQSVRSNIKNSANGKWCSNKKTHYKQKREGKIKTYNEITDEQIGLLEELGFEWSRQPTFVQRIADIAAYKKEHGQGMNPSSGPSSENKSLGRWCCTTRRYYKGKDDKNPANPLTQYQIERLEEFGIPEWCLCHSYRPCLQK